MLRVLVKRNIEVVRFVVLCVRLFFWSSEGS